jgi:hypothetical protein
MDSVHHIIECSSTQETRKREFTTRSMTWRALCIRPYWEGGVAENSDGCVRCPPSLTAPPLMLPPGPAALAAAVVAAVATAAAVAEATLQWVGTAE